MKQRIRSSLKRAVHGLAMVIVLPAFLLYKLLAFVEGAERAFPGWSQAFALLPGFTGIYLRRAFYRLVLTRCEHGSSLCFGTVLSRPTAEIGKDAYVGLYCCLGTVTIEDDVMIGSHVSIPSGGRQHGTDRTDLPMRQQPGSWTRVTIGRNSWIGDRAVVLADVGSHCVIGAGAVVTEPIPDFAVAVGVPARVIRYRGRVGEAEAERAAEDGQQSVSSTFSSG
jgi:acetyltransferase-like isoleucine patch superfamily enzyme